MKGFQFSQTWPKSEPYLLMFEQTKIIRFNDLMFTVAPAVTLVTAWLQISVWGLEQISTTMAMSLLILSIPAHGYYQLGQQADRTLSLGLQSWYREIEQNINKKSEPEQPKLENRKPNNKLTYMDLAIILKKLFS